MSRRDGVLVAVTILLLGGAAAVTFSQFVGPDPSDDFPDGVHFVCTSPSCDGGGFTMSFDEYLAFSREKDTDSPDGPPCPACGGGDTERAGRCPECKEYFTSAEVSRENPVCPHCGVNFAETAR